MKVEVGNINDFEIGSVGVTFLFDAGFPHAVKALEPEGRYFFTYPELAPHIKPEGLLAQFVK